MGSPDAYARITLGFQNWFGGRAVFVRSLGEPSRNVVFGTRPAFNTGDWIAGLGVATLGRIGLIGLIAFGRRKGSSFDSPVFAKLSLPIQSPSSRFRL